MKLAFVALDISYPLPGFGSLSEFNADEMEGLPEMRFDRDTWSLRFVGTGRGLGWGHVVHWVEDDVELVCPMCGEGSFKNTQALGGHKRFCKGKRVGPGTE